MDTYEKNALAFNKQLTVNAIQTTNLDRIAGRRKPDAIIAVGMGGSGLAASLLQNLANDVKIPVPVIPWKNFGLPQIPYARSPLYLFLSFSGNTKEVLDGFALANRGHTKIAVVGSGGKLVRLAMKERFAVATFPPGNLEPRQATGFLFYGALRVLNRVWPSVTVPDLTTRVKPYLLRSLARRIAHRIGGRNIAVIADWEDGHLAYYWKAHFNEAGKTLTSWNVLPEMNHNEVMVFELKPKNLIVLFLEGNPRDKKIRMIRKVTREVIEVRGTPTLAISGKGKNTLERTMNSLALAGLVSIEVARHKGIDPRTIGTINELKERMPELR